MIRWLCTSENWFARWFTQELRKKKNPRIPRQIQEQINRAEYDAMMYGINPVPQYESIYKKLSQ